MQTSGPRRAEHRLQHVLAHSRWGSSYTSSNGRLREARPVQQISLLGRQRPVRSRGSSRLTGPCQCSGSADGGARPATAMVIGNVSNTLATAAGCETACMAERPQSVRDREFEVRPRPAATGPSRCTAVAYWPLNWSGWTGGLPVREGRTELARGDRCRHRLLQE